MEPTLQFISSAAEQRENLSNKSGDFANSEDLKSYMPKLIESIMMFENTGIGPFPSGIPDPQSVSVPENNLSLPENISIEKEMRSGQFDGSSMLKNGIRQLPGDLNMAASLLPNDKLIHHQPYSIPPRQVLSEPCTLSQPINASLRDAYSTGTFYFLK